MMIKKSLLTSGVILTVAFVGQILAAWLLYNPQANALVINLGWIMIMFSAIFGWLPIFTFRARGKIEGRSYINTTVLVDSGVYSIVRHPQYLAGILLNIALPLITFHWLVIVLGIIAWVITYLNTFDEEEDNIDKFGEEYQVYQEKVPRLNFLLGLYRLVQRKRKPGPESGSR
ncbi:MAG: isoprenylcysteine carboxylmethyltransferase family protein [Anaerolineales bacterium]